MKKVLLISDSDRFPQGAFRFIKQLAENETIFVKGLFISSLSPAEAVGMGIITIAEPILKKYRNESILLNGNKQKFTLECESIGIRYTIHPNESVWDTELFVKESRFSDLVVISDEAFPDMNQIAEPNYIMEHVFRLSECPVMVVPEGHREISRLTVAYNGTAESMFALKQFVYLFPYFVDYPSEFIQVKNEGLEDIPDRELLQEYTNAHFEAMFASELHFDAKKYFTTWIENKKNVVLIVGAYSRSSVSNKMRKSFANRTIADHTCPVFIAHHVR